MSKRLALVILLFVTVNPLPALCSERTFADVVAAFVPGNFDLGSGLIDTTWGPGYCVGFGAEPLDVSAVLGPKDNRYASIGNQGKLTLAFSDRTVVDGPGDDFVVYGDCSNGPGQVLVSADGISFVSLGSLQSGSKSFDLASAGIKSAKFVRIDDLPEGQMDLPEGFDVDALEALHVEGAVAAKEASWGHLKASYR